MIGRTVLALVLVAAFAISIASSLRPASAQPTPFVPAQGSPWQWQLTTPVDTTVDVRTYDIDLFDNDASLVGTLHSQGKKAICYLDAGTWENCRPDVSSFPDSVKGKKVSGWRGERWLQAHQRGLGVALKNDVDQTIELQPYFDFAIDEQCFQYSECSTEQPFIDAGKAVLEVEYKLDTSKFCDRAKAMHFSSMKKHLNLDAWRMPC